jgi:hypothetical protein
MTGITGDYKGKRRRIGGQRRRQQSTAGNRLGRHHLVGGQ